VDDRRYNRDDHHSNENDANASNSKYKKLSKQDQSDDHDENKDAMNADVKNDSSLLTDENDENGNEIIGNGVKR